MRVPLKQRCCVFPLQFDRMAHNALVMNEGITDGHEFDYLLFGVNAKAMLHARKYMAYYHDNITIHDNTTDTVGVRCGTNALL